MRSPAQDRPSASLNMLRIVKPSPPGPPLLCLQSAAVGSHRRSAAAFVYTRLREMNLQRWRIMWTSGSLRLDRWCTHPSSNHRQGIATLSLRRCLPRALACSKGDSRTEMREKRPSRQQNLPLLEVIEITVITLIASQCFSNAHRLLSKPRRHRAVRKPCHADDSANVRLSSCH